MASNAQTPAAKAPGIQALGVERTHVTLQQCLEAASAAMVCERSQAWSAQDNADKLLSAMRFKFGGHLEKSTEKSQAA